jgi:L-ascorbate metabolism protein UlaG (beta-lactamase superfamily)
VVTSADAEPAAVDPIRIDVQFVGHATALIQVAGVRILTDPFLRDRLGPLERHGPLPDPQALGPVDIVLISHGHPDHFDRVSLSAIGGRPVVIVPRGLGRVARRWIDADVHEMATGDLARFGDLSIEAVPARHWVTPGAARGEPQGYLLDAGARIWFCGDTGRLPANRRPTGPIDLALMPVWTWGPHRGPGHLGPKSAAEMLRDVDAAVAVPIHWGTLYPRRLHRLLRAPLTEPGDRFARHAASLAPRADVRVLRPGDSTTISLGEASGGPRST